MAEPNIIWLASYTKSGNTWFRAFLSAFFNDGQVNLCNLNHGKLWYSNKRLPELYLDTCLDDLHIDEIQPLRKLAYSELNKSLKEPLFVKIHDAFNSSFESQNPIIPEVSSRHIIYIVRNPLDVALSFANHKAVSYEKIARQFINNEKGYLSKKNNSSHEIYQFMGSWTQHVEGWLNQKKIPVHLVKYEDMKNKPYETFPFALKTLGIPYNTAKIEKAITACSFENLKQQEEKFGFFEKPSSNKVFFNKGETGRGLKEIPPHLVNEIINKNKKMMARLGYL